MGDEQNLKPYLLARGGSTGNPTYSQTSRHLIFHARPHSHSLLTFSQKTDKGHHARHASLNQWEPKLVKTWNIRKSSILFVDDCIATGTTARLCYEALVALGNHVDG